MSRASDRAAREVRRRQVAEMYLRGKTIRAIAIDLGVSHGTVGNDVQIVLAEWREERLDDIDALQSAELTRISKLEETYWEAWDRSVTERKRSTTERMTTTEGEGDGDGQVTKRDRAAITKDELLGDARFLAGVQWCIDRRCKILGLDAPERHEILSDPFERLPRAQLEEAAQRADRTLRLVEGHS